MFHLCGSVAASSPISLVFDCFSSSRCKPQYKNFAMAVVNVKSYLTRQARFRLCNVSGYMTELLEIQADNPDFHVLFIPGNPGIVNFYKGFLESLYELLEGNASVTAIGHLSQTSKDWENGRLFSLQEQIIHKMDFIDYKLHNKEVPIVLVGHSIGSYISIEIFKRYPGKVIHCIGLYPFLALNAESSKQIAIKKLADSRVLSLTASLVLSLLGLLLPIPALRFIVKKSFGNSWSADAVDTACSHLVLYHIIQNMLFMARTEFKKLSETPDWEFMRAKKDQIAFLFGSDDHWGPLSMFEEISKQVHGVDMSIETEGYDHAFSCTEAGSLWVARHVACLINKHVITTT
ncbi:hypothetical protein Nepgr_030552 [Nepenthes gracilis]|uniref:Lipid droplet-associated hydrolase n=1 Tax=Nepenthes gracilis TaxID=150966 RepID=A0AAD3Y662_NEPGR|nr:hypothetical protein Nepgr_030552 [Nepenthes gracilis]